MNDRSLRTSDGSSESPFWNSGQFFETIDVPPEVIRIASEMADHLLRDPSLSDADRVDVEKASLQFKAIYPPPTTRPTQALKKAA